MSLIVQNLSEFWSKFFQRTKLIIFSAYVVKMCTILLDFQKNINSFYAQCFARLVDFPTCKICSV